MINEEWLCSSFKLCELVNTSESGHDSGQIVIISDSSPQPAYNPSSIQYALETYSRLLDATLEHNREPIQRFAEMTAQTIIDSTVRLRDPSKSVKVRQDEVEMLAEELTLQVCCKALEEMERHHYSEDPSSKNIYDGIMVATHENTPVLCSTGCDKNTSEMETDCKMEEYDDAYTIAYATSLKSMASFGSIEYPDAPPSTPLLPEMIRSRASFTRKLKGGLAKEFLPSPPPPTPKDHMQPLLENQTADTPADFVVRLMRSLSLECYQNGGEEKEESTELEDGQNNMLTDYAAQLSAEILNFIPTNEVKDKGCLKCMLDIADQLAGEIVSGSLANVMVSEKRKDKIDMSSAKRSSIPVSTADRVEVLASEIIINAIVQAFAKLRQDEVKHETQPYLSGRVVKPQPWEEERHSNTVCKDSINSHKAFSKSELNTISADDTKVASLVQRFANDFAELVLQQSIFDAFSLCFSCKQSERSDIVLQKDKNIKIIKIRTEESHQIQELQCVLLWAAASLRGSSALQFDLPDTRLQQQLCRLSRNACLNGWTVAALMASLHQFCDMQQASRGRYESSESLLEHLQHLTDNVCLN
ncbi:uncharacterized protein si:dkey-171c9.3 [Danio aesculapii]|uniref:uncharacterized protein si:dkey-171c9.3 n=1 Tax=Danio aesculapii TaxID=1142201 RepID=UPI0024C0BB23|nr:uncharacterized protein si:dkey-171c9.3 [Danio aesculapii]